VPWKRTIDNPEFVANYSYVQTDSALSYDFHSTVQAYRGYASARINFAANTDPAINNNAFFNQQHIHLCPNSFYTFNAVRCLLYEGTLNADVLQAILAYPPEQFCRVDFFLQTHNNYQLILGNIYDRF
jgi:hypothetical protein